MDLHQEGGSHKRAAAKRGRQLLEGRSQRRAAANVNRASSDSSLLAHFLLYTLWAYRILSDKLVPSNAVTKVARRMETKNIIKRYFHGPRKRMRYT